MAEQGKQMFLGANTYIQVAEYISGDRWWLDKDGVNWWNRKDRFRHNAIYLPKVGEFDLKIGSTWYHIIPETLVFIPADSDLEFFFDGNGPLEKYYVHFDLTFGAHQLSDYFKIPHVIPLQDADRIERIMADLRRYTADNASPAAQLAANGSLLSLVAEMIWQSDAAFVRTPKNLDPQMRSTLEYIEQHFKESLSVSELAERVGYSNAYFTKKFKKAFGTTPTEYIANIKIGYAKQWLLEGTRSIHAIAETLGFCDASYFSNFFKSKTGLYPGYYRKKKR